jgi:hypothetical protein
MTDEPAMARDAPVQDGARIAHLRIDLRQLKEMSAVGVRRAAAFLGIGLNATSREAPPPLALTDQSMWRFFPTPEPLDVAKAAVAEFRLWVVGNALRELDAHFSMFLDQVWTNLQIAKLHGTSVPSDHVIKGSAGNTNAANKLGRLLGELGAENPDGGSLRSLSNTRNCLVHAHGIVTERHAHTDGALEVKWLGLEARLQQGEHYVVFGPEILDRHGIQAPDSTKEAEVIVAVVERVRRFKLGERVILTPYELHEICFNYQRMTDKVIHAFQAFLAAKGIFPPNPEAI